MYKRLSHLLLDLLNRRGSGGIARDMVMLRGRPEAVREQVQDAIKQTGGRRYIVGTGCVTMIPSPEVNVQTAIDTARQWGG